VIWSKVKLGEVCKLHYGKSLTEYQDLATEEHGVRVFGTNGPIGWTKAALTDHPTLVIGRKGAYRGVHRSEDPSWTIDTAFYTTIDGDRLLLKWFYYRLLLLDINRMNSGGAIPSTSRDDFYAVEIRIPSPPVQATIASFLSVYDDLIENNTRRVALLEEAARILYREWFVHFRFPGHEHVKIINGIPEGWDTQTLTALCSPEDGIQTGPFGSQLHQSDYTDDGVPVVMPKDIIDCRISTASIARIPEELADRLGRHRMRIGDTVYGRRGDIGRRAYIGRRQNEWFCGTGCLRIRPDPSLITPRFLYEALGSPATAGFIANQAKGSTMPNLSAGALKDVPIICPPRSLQRAFLEVVEPMNELVENLSEQTTKLAQARDLLLPRLMNGEIAV
jgi:type I restriction enzyme S subunit